MTYAELRAEIAHRAAEAYWAEIEFETVSTPSPVRLKRADFPQGATKALLIDKFGRDVEIVD